MTKTIKYISFLDAPRLIGEANEGGRRMRAIPMWELSKIMISLEGTGMLLLEPPHNFEYFTHGEVQQGQIDLTYEEADRLAQEILTALHSCATIAKTLTTLESE